MYRTTSEPSYGVVVLSYGRGPALACVERLLAGGVPASHVLVVHNPSHAGEHAPSMPAGVQVETMAANVGYGAAMNTGLRHWRGHGREVALLCTHDVEVEAAGAFALVAAVSNEATIAAAGPVIERRDGEGTSAGGLVSRLGDVRQRPPGGDGTVAVDWLDGALLALDLGVGVEFIEDFFLYWEDVALGIDLRAAGRRVVCLEQERAYATSGAASREQVFAYLHWRNRLAFARRRRRRAMLAYSSAKLVAALARRLVLNERRWPRRRLLLVYVLALRDGLALRLGTPPERIRRGSDVS
jgi:GT2 family glycosyltransferase